MNHRIFWQNFVLLAFDKSKTQLRSMLGSTLCPRLLLEGVRCPHYPLGTRPSLPCLHSTLDNKQQRSTSCLGTWKVIVRMYTVIKKMGMSARKRALLYDSGKDEPQVPLGVMEVETQTEGFSRSIQSNSTSLQKDFWIFTLRLCPQPHSAPWPFLFLCPSVCLSTHSKWLINSSLSRQLCLVLSSAS